MEKNQFMAKVEKYLGFKFACNLHVLLSSSKSSEVYVQSMLKKALAVINQNESGIAA